MLQELAARGTQTPDLLTRMITPIVRHGARRMLRWMPDASVGVELPSGQRVRFGSKASAREPLLKLNNFRVIGKAIRRGSIGFAEAYIDGDIECDNLVALFRFFIRNRDRFERTGGALFRSRTADWIAHLVRANTARGSRRNICEHYDLGNAFYREWLDADLNYSSGLFTTSTETLEEAQQAKLDRVLKLLELTDGERILEIGCGWGALAYRAAERFGADVKGITLSHEQLAHARARAAALKTTREIEFRLQDYRGVDGRYDHVVSIEMIEAVGEENWPRYFEMLHDRLKPGGTAVIQSITIEEHRFGKYRRKADFIQRYIFPGGMLPTPDRIRDHAARARLTLERSERFGQSYALTLREWRRRFEAAWPRIAALGFDETFRRKWRYYLAYCEAGFSEGAIDVGLYRLRRD